MRGRLAYGNVTWTPELRARLAELAAQEFMDDERIFEVLSEEFKGRNFTLSKVKSAISNFALPRWSVRHTQRRMDRKVMALPDPRIVYGAHCLWWDSIDKVALTPDKGDGIRIPCCPHCGSVLYEKANMEEWMRGLDAYERTHIGYQKFLDWLRGKCFPCMKLAKKAYTQETGISLTW